MALIRTLLSNVWIRAALALAVMAGVIVLAKMWHDTMRDPVIQRLTIESKHLPPGSPPVTIAFLSDIHVAGPDMPPSRLERIVQQTNALNADLIAIAGDLVSEKMAATKHYEAGEIVAPLAALSAPLGVVLVPGNHDHWFGWPELSGELALRTNITVLENGAAQFGPIAMAGVDDDFIGRSDIAATSAAILPLSGAQVWLSHSPDIFPSVPVSADLVLAGHTHCGQIAYPWGGSPATMSDYGETYACGVKELHGKTLVTSAGLGTSLLPVRLFTQPEIWVIELRPAAR